MFPLYPEIKPYNREMLAVDDTHEVYIDESGTATGIPALVVHDGPGAGCEFNSRCFFDPEKYRIILFDQRGAGRSTPHCEIEDNSLDLLVDDMEMVREHLAIDRWLLFGGGWGSTLALAYAERHSDRVAGLVLRGVFLGRPGDIRWIYQTGASAVFPDHFEDFASLVPVDQRDDFIEGYYRLAHGEDELAKMGAAKAWALWDAQCASLHPNQRLIKHYTAPHRALGKLKIASHYFRHDCFLEPNQILDNASAIAGIPGIIVHGRFDVVCPLENAYSLHRAWPDSQLFIVREAGHAATEPSIIDALIRATRDMALRLGGS